MVSGLHRRGTDACVRTYTHTFIERAYIHQVEDLPNFFIFAESINQDFCLISVAFLSLSLSICVFDNLHFKTEKQDE